MIRSNNVLSIFVGEQSQHLAYNFYHLQAEQLFDQEENSPKIDNKVVWKNLEKHLPRCLIYDLKGNIKLLQHQNRTNNKKIITKLQGQPVGLSLMGDLQQQINYKLKGVQGKPAEEQEEEAEWKQLFDNFDIQQKALIESGRHSSKKQWELYYGGKNITKREQQMDKLSDPIRKQLEAQDYTQGFMMFGEISNGYASITQTLINQLHNFCPKTPLFLTGITSSSKTPSQAETLNTLISYSSFLPICDIFLPMNIQSQDYPFFDGASNLGYKSISPLISNMYYPFMIGNSFGEYVKNITQYRHNNLFNACYTVPLIVEESLDKLYSVLRYLHPKSNKLNYMRPLSNYNFNPSFRSYSQTYVLKGGFNIEEDQIPRMSYIDFKMTDIIFSQKDKLSFTQSYHEAYGKQVDTFPFHSLIFSHECLKGDILDVANSLKGIENVVLERYYAEGVEKDELKEMSNQMVGFYDNYDSKGTEGEEDDLY